MVVSYRRIFHYFLILWFYDNSEIQRMLFSLPIRSLRRYEMPQLRFLPYCSQSYCMHYHTISNYLVTFYIFHSRVENVIALLHPIFLCAVYKYKEISWTFVLIRKKKWPKCLHDSCNADGCSQLATNYSLLPGKASAHLTTAVLVHFTELYCPQATSGWWGHCWECSRCPSPSQRHWGQTSACAAVCATLASRLASRLVPGGSVRAETKVKCPVAFLPCSTGQAMLWQWINDTVSEAVLYWTSICSWKWDFIIII